MLFTVSFNDPSSPHLHSQTEAKKRKQILTLQMLSLPFSACDE